MYAFTFKVGFIFDRPLMKMKQIYCALTFLIEFKIMYINIDEMFKIYDPAQCVGNTSTSVSMIPILDPYRVKVEPRTDKLHSFILFIDRCGML